MGGFVVGGGYIVRKSQLVNEVSASSPMPRYTSANNASSVGLSERSLHGTLEVSMSGSNMTSDKKRLLPRSIVKQLLRAEEHNFARPDVS